MKIFAIYLNDDEPQNPLMLVSANDYFEALDIAKEKIEDDLKGELDEFLRAEDICLPTSKKNYICYFDQYDFFIKNKYE